MKTFVYTMLVAAAAASTMPSADGAAAAGAKMQGPPLTADGKIDLSNVKLPEGV
jgi:hypothetical protein